MIRRYEVEYMDGKKEEFIVEDGYRTHGGLLFFKEPGSGKDATAVVMENVRAVRPIEQ